MKRKKRSQGIRDKNARKNYNNNIKVSNSKSRFDVNSSEDKHSPPPSSSIDSSLMQKSLSASTITKKQAKKISSRVIDSSKYEPAGEKEEGESLSAATIYEKDIGNRKNEFFGIQTDESISPEMSVSTKLSAIPDSINSNSNFSNANSVIIEKEVEVVEKQVEQVEQQQPSTVTDKANEGEKEEGESLSSIAFQYRNNKNLGNDGKRNFGNNKSNIKNNNNYNNPHIGGISIGMLQNPAIAWFDMYNELSRNAARMTERWLNLFWNPWITSERKNNNTKK
jgi:hypothetical protein